ncbi:MAG: DUF1553 domain-containing protein [Planctomycetaceae bacterium]
MESFKKWEVRGGRPLQLWRLVLGLAVLLLAGRAAGNAIAAELEPVSFLKDVRPVLAQRCFRCHSESLHQEGNLKLDTNEGLLKGGDSGAVVLPGDSKQSLLVSMVRHENDRKMPPEGDKLSDEQIGKIAKWIDEGAKLPTAEELARPSHWSFLSPMRSTIDASLARDGNNSIDALVASEYAKQGLVPNGLATKHVLIRRLYLDLVGIPPTADEVAAFVADDRPDAFERVVDQLLASPMYAERWARHWMDVWRYSDWDGYGAEVRESRPHIWRWRDWIVESLSADRGYDQMVREMLAADEIAPLDTKRLPATGFLVRNWYKFNRNQWLDSTVEHTGKAFLGLTFNCCRCHNHMYDPLTQKEYYQLRAFFEPHEIRTDRVPGEANVDKDGLVRVYDAKLDAPTYLFVRGNEKEPLTTEALLPSVPKVLAFDAVAAKDIAIPLEGQYPSRKEFVVAETLAAAKNVVVTAERVVVDAKTKLDAAKAAPVTDAAAHAEAVLVAEQQLQLVEKSLLVARASEADVIARQAADAATFAIPAIAAEEVKRLAMEAVAKERQTALQKAEYAVLDAEQKAANAQKKLKPGDMASEKLVEQTTADLNKAKEGLTAAQQAAAQPGEAYTKFGEVFPKTSTGRRTALAEWIVDKRNPLTARVAVNHLWLRHFGAPLVPSVFDLGMNGKAPKNPQLLDQLAVELMDGGWEMKRMHRQMVNSKTYQLSSQVDETSAANRKVDPDNQFFWRGNTRRMEAEAVRDSLLAMAGGLDLRMGGSDLDPNEWLTRNRRSLYFRNTKEKKVTFLALFDSPNVAECYRRSESIAPQQALALVNSPLALTKGREIAKQLLAEHFAGREMPASIAEGEYESLIQKAYLRILSRPAKAEELNLCKEFCIAQAKQFQEPTKLTAIASGPAASLAPATRADLRAFENVVHVLLNHNDFVTIR